MADNLAAAASTSPNNVSIRVIALAHATMDNEDIHLVVSLDSSIAQLKERLQQNLTKHPSPEAQRLIYQGRPLLDGNALLRSILRLESNMPGSPPVHVLHLVVREDQSTLPTNAARPPSTSVQDPVPSTQDNQGQRPGIPQPPGLHFVPQAFAHGPATNAAFQNIIQQHMASVAAMHQQAHQAMHNNPHIPISVPPFGHRDFPRNDPRLTPHPQNDAQQSNSLSPPLHPNAPRSASANSPHPNDSSNSLQSSFSMQVEEEIIGPNGERQRRVVHSRPGLPIHANPMERPASAPGLALRPETPSTQFRPMANFPHHTPILPHLHHPPPTGFPQIAGRIPLIPSNVNPIHPTTMPQPRNPTVYLVSSPTGPEALLFTPDHGTFSSQPASEPQESLGQAVTQTHDGGDNVPQMSPTQTVQPEQGSTQPNEQSQVAVRPQGPVPAPAPAPGAAANPGQVQAQPGRREGEDLVALILQRGWLFLRLYMFIFVLSEPGTWRRYILLIIASLVCLLPQNNPFTEIFQVARRHFDNLIGPPQPPGGAQRQQANNRRAARVEPEINDPANTTTGPGSSAPDTPGTTQMPTPQQHAQRLLRDHEQQNPNIVRDAFYRVEQGVALFLASLIPGVGERHVRAREEARRIEQQERQQRRAEAERIAQQNSDELERKPDGAHAGPSQSVTSTTAASATASTGVDISSSDRTPPSASGEGVRMRNANAGDQSSAA